MYLRKVTLENIRGFEQFTWEVEAGQEAGWHVLVGENGCGKTTVLRAVALALVGPLNSAALQRDRDALVRQGAERGEIEVTIVPGPSDIPSPSRRLPPTIRLAHVTTLGSSATPSAAFPDKHFPLLDSIWNRPNGARGWFSASFGPHRRPVGEPLPRTGHPLERHLTLFEDRWAFPTALEWLVILDHQSTDKNRPTARLLRGAALSIANSSGFLPAGVKIGVDADGVHAYTGSGARLEIADLPEGAKSILCVVVELLRRLAEAYGEEVLANALQGQQCALPGLVMIDEVDAHLHPTWQHRIGTWLTAVFPRTQFLVTTHSPIICQAATSVWVLPAPGSEEEVRRLQGQDLDRLRYGSILDAFSTGAFGEGVTRSEEGKRRLKRLAELNAKDFTVTLTTEEQRERDALRAATPTASLGSPLLKEAKP
jgi:energy-coupling factor transporter ATP-binding protein EcfA2